VITAREIARGKLLFFSGTTSFGSLRSNDVVSSIFQAKSRRQTSEYERNVTHDLSPQAGKMERGMKSILSHQSQQHFQNRSFKVCFPEQVEAVYGSLTTLC
jgi:hypothetical protein